MKICFVALHAYPCLKNDFSIDERIGGAEIQQILIAREFKKRGLNISFITSDYGQKDEEIIDGIKVYKASKPKEGFKFIRFFYPNLVKLWKALKRANAEIYYVRGAGFIPGVLALFSKMYGKKFVFGSASDTNFCLSKLKKTRLKRDLFLYVFGLKRANAIIVQNNKQKEDLLRNFRLNGILIRNYYRPIVNVNNPQKNIILWVSTIKEIKRPELFIELARNFPNEKFVMIGGPNKKEDSFYDYIKEKSKKIKNLTFMGFQPFEFTEKIFESCKLFVNTSNYEGFPNTFLQAWSRGIPVLSTVDPDNIVKENGLGLVAKNESELILQMKNFVDRKINFNENKIKKFFYENFSESIINQYLKLFKELC